MRLVALLFCAALLAGQAQTAPEDLCRVEGKVVNSATGQGVPKATVTLSEVSPRRASAQAPAAFKAATDPEGNFILTGVPPGKYMLTAQRENFQLVAPRGFPAVELSAGDRKTGIVAQLMPYGVITGRVHDEDGDPLINVQVVLMVYQYTQNGRQLQQRNAAATDDRGVYRIFSVQPGEYYVRAAKQGLNAANEIYAPAYYPGAADASGAAPVELAAGQEMQGVDLTLHPTHAVSVRGRILNIPSTNARVGVSFRPKDGLSGGFAAGAAAGPDGSFVLPNVLPGAYLLAASIQLEQKNYSCERLVQVGPGGLEGVDLTLLPPVDVKGVIRIEGDYAFKISQLRVQLPAAGGLPVTHDDGSFEILNVPPNLYHPTVIGPGGALYLKSVRCGSADVTESGMDLTQGGGCELTITMANGAKIEGQVQDDDGQPATGMVTLVPAGTRRDDLFQAASTDAAGHFGMIGIAPGSYQLYAWENNVDVNGVRWDADFRRPYEAQAKRLEISEGDKQTVTLKRIPQPEK